MAFRGFAGGGGGQWGSRPGVAWGGPVRWPGIGPSQGLFRTNFSVSNKPGVKDCLGGPAGPSKKKFARGRRGDVGQMGPRLRLSSVARVRGGAFSPRRGKGPLLGLGPKKGAVLSRRGKIRPLVWGARGGGTKPGFPKNSFARGCPGKVNLRIFAAHAPQGGAPRKGAKFSWAGLDFWSFSEKKKNFSFAKERRPTGRLGDPPGGRTRALLERGEKTVSKRGRGLGRRSCCFCYARGSFFQGGAGAI